MRDVIALALVAVLAPVAVLLFRLLKPAHGRHAADPAHVPVSTPEPAPVSLWSSPWRSPSREEAAELFQRQAEDTLELRAIQERRRAVFLATLGEDYPYSYPGAPFPASSFTTAGVSA
ncbi:hypothetical protein QZH56_05005 [Streptomyces olivoreticuli]|uniref:hypothetical protein n=1 Tax=Streptomyces olivoreticuli TaxID=68246 RepID=UPI00265AE1A1|nr:hypothetical protein [Streptomyces olivoreticuli]WKK24983.1 hypothetical protein QZH56_05005 [Streptomyces olivoreticuli]